MWFRATTIFSESACMNESGPLSLLTVIVNWLSSTRLTCASDRKQLKKLVHSGYGYQWYDQFLNLLNLHDWQLTPTGGTNTTDYWPLLGVPTRLTTDPYWGYQHGWLLTPTGSTNTTDYWPLLGVPTRLTTDPYWGYQHDWLLTMVMVSTRVTSVRFRVWNQQQWNHYQPGSGHQ